MSYKMTAYMLGKQVVIKKDYILLSVSKNNIRHCASYSCDDKNLEQITSIATGEVFYTLRSFVESILGFNTTNEWEDCCYYDDYNSDWYPMKLLIAPYDLYIYNIEY